jgi:hypothetical protein
MSRSRIAEWSYQLGCVSAVVVIIYRFFGVRRIRCAFVRRGTTRRSPQLHGSQHSVAGDLDRHQYPDTDSSRGEQRVPLGQGLVEMSRGVGGVVARLKMGLRQSVFAC